MKKIGIRLYMSAGQKKTGNGKYYLDISFFCDKICFVSNSFVSNCFRTNSFRGGWYGKTGRADWL